jgi:hypothetical protein
MILRKVLLMKIMISNIIMNPIKHRLADNVDWRDRRAVACSTNTPETLERLANDNHYNVRRGVALNPNTPPETLERLANDDYYWVRYCVAENPNTPPETLEHLVEDGDSLIREAVALNINASPETLERLANYGEHYVSIALALSFFTPQYIKDYLKIKEFLNYNPR